MRDCFRVFMLLCSLLVLMTSTPGSTAAQPPRATAAPEPHLSLSVEPATLPLNSGLVTLHIDYIGVGLHETTVSLSPDNVLIFDPPRSTRCRYDQDPSACTRMTLRPLAPGIVTIRASAYGEIFDPNCGCWRFSSVSDDGPVQVMITGAQVFIPVIQR